MRCAVMEELAARQEQAQPVHRVPPRAVPRVLQPDQAERQDAVDGCAIFVWGRRQDGMGFRTATDKAPRVGTRNGMVQVRGGDQRLNGFVGEMVRQDPAQAVGKLFALHAARFARRAARDEFKLRVPRVAEPADFEHDAIAGFFRDAEHAANQGLLRAPQMQQGRVALRAHFVLHAVEPRQPFPVFAHFGRADGAQSIEGASQFGGQLHWRELSNRRAKRGSHFS